MGQATPQPGPSVIQKQPGSSAIQKQPGSSVIQKYGEVAVDAPVGHNRTFSYSVPPNLDLSPGQLVLVPFGARKLQGIVFSLELVPQVSETRAILSASSDGHLLTDIQLRLARWTSTYYICSLFDAAALMLPPGGRARERTYLSPAADPQDHDRTPLTPHQQRVMQYLRRRQRVEEGKLLGAMGRGTQSAVRRLVAQGLVARTQRRVGTPVGHRYRQLLRLAPGVEEELRREIPGLAGRWPRRAALLERLLTDGTALSVADARKEYGHSAVSTLLKHGSLLDEAVPEDRDPLAGLAVAPSGAVVLTQAQEDAAAAVRTALSGGSAARRAFLLEGVTGSGKTEVYLDAVEHCLRLGKRAIVLVPEIALTHQSVERFSSRFPGRVALLHSGLSPGQRFDQWWKVRRGEYPIVIGSRSAVFAPQPDLGLIVIDEEHEWTYKQHDSSPRYHDKVVALKLASLCGAAVVLGSASPDVESYHSALNGSLRLVRLPHRVLAGGGSGPTHKELASVRVVDMRTELREGNRRMFSRALLRDLGECLEEGSQAILFLNRRGSASSIQCRKCGQAVRCRRCDIPMAYHRVAQRLLCHYCGDRRAPPDRCPRCQADGLAYYGIGTQAVADEVVSRFPGATVLRWDRDAAETAAAHEELLNRFRSGEAQVLVGTQMIAKGLHFPSVTVVGVVSADVGLNIPDYRAGERVFQLLCQVAGRAGRGPAPGRVIVQTYQPDNYAIRSAATQDYKRFYDQEVAYRREHGNPPFSKLIRLLYMHTNRALCEREALRLAAVLRRERDAWGHFEVEVLGPTPAYPARLRGRHRWQVLLRGPSPRVLLDRATVPQGWLVDVDPVGPG